MKSVAVLVAALAGLALAAPAPDVAAPAARDIRVRFFTKDHFEGREYTDETELKECRNVPKEANDRIRSIKIDSDRARCTFYNSRNCRGDNFTPRRGSDVPVMGDEFKVEISSYLCEERRRDGDRDRGRDRDRG